MTVHVSLFLVLFFCNFVQASSNNDLDFKLRNLETFLLQRISNLEGVVTEQKQRISNLEGVVNEQKNEIANFKKDVEVLRLQTNTNAKDTSKLREILLRNRDIQLPMTKHSLPRREIRDRPKNTKSMIGDGQPDRIRDRRLLLNGGGGSRVAFYALMSVSEPVAKHKTLIFDVIKSNFGHGYNNNTGTFTAPTSGVYVLTFTVHPGSRSYTSIQLVVNQEIEGVAFADSSASDPDLTGVTAIVVVWMNQGDVSFVRTHPTYGPSGTVFSSNLARCSFAGWLLSD